MPTTKQPRPSTGTASPQTLTTLPGSRIPW
nr:MAG TPA: hypothetical protein [Caudoviricetes sp.]